MANRWRIPPELELEVIERDKSCVYCGVAFGNADAPRRERPSWEHIVNDARIITRENIARCCIACNASKGTKNLEEWFLSSYCAAKQIGPESVAQIVRKAIQPKG
jgi:biotin synthase-like enzyme